MYRADTIVACATPVGRGAVAVVRCSGRDVTAISERIFRPKRPGPLRPWHMRLGTVLAADGHSALDEALAVLFPASRSFTGEDVLELHCHGSPVVVEQVVASAISAGARAAERGEFTRRAVINGRIDLVQAEAVADLIDSRMAAGARSAWNQLQGSLSAELDRIRRRLVAVLAEIEADVDFTEDELPAFTTDARVRGLDETAAEIARLLGGFAGARRLREGVRVAFTGKPNAGKSSLVNRLLGCGRMIVSDEPGTTRDAVDEAVELDGVALVLTDTAGLRETSSAAEAAAVERAREAAAEADLRVVVVDASLEDADGDPDADDNTVVVWNKSDLGIRRADGPASGRAFVTSAKSGEGCEALAVALASLARSRIDAEPAGVSRVRHRVALERAARAIGRARELAAAAGTEELAALELRTALAEISSITLPLDNEEVLDSIFSTFCIGK